MNELQELNSSNILADSELRHELHTHSRAGVPCDRHMEASFSIDESRDVRLQPFLLIDRTCRIFTIVGAHVRNVLCGCDVVVSDDE